jgi:hypothetical protein
VVSETGPAAPSRRALLRIAAGGAAAVALPGCGADKTTSSTTTTTPTRPAGPDVAALGPVLDLVHMTTAAYVAGIPLLSGPASLAAQLFLTQELSHAGELGGLIRQAGGKASQPKSSYPLGHPSSQADVLSLLHRLEQAEMAAYIQMIPRLHTPASRAALASILANDAQHASILRLLLGRNPAPSALLTDHA